MSGYKRVPREWPWWVRLTLLGTKSRAALWAWIWVSLALAVVLIIVGLWTNGPFYTVLGAIGGPLAAAMYWLTIRWIDRNGSWDAMR
jgi:hypothetical protein